MSQIAVLRNIGGIGGNVVSLTGDAGGAVSSDVLGNINLVTGVGLTSTGDPASNTITFTVQTPTVSDFMAYPTSAANVTGDGTVYTVPFAGVVWNIGGNFDGTSTFTAPVSGYYLFDYSISMNNIQSNHTVMELYLVTTSQAYRNMMSPKNCCDANSNLTVTNSIIAKMSAGDTAIVQLAVYNGSKVIAIFTAAQDSHFSGHLLK